MKNNLILTMIVMSLSLASMAQDNKPVAGTFGIGFGLYLSPLSESVAGFYNLTGNITVGGSIKLSFNKSSNSTFDSTTVLGANYVTQNETQVSSTTVGITPMFQYHFTTKNNLDIYTGAYIPISITPTTKTVTSANTTASNYDHDMITTNTGPVTTGIGVMVPLGCRWFFVKNLAAGLEAGLGFNASFASGNDKTSVTTNDSGSSNPAGTTTTTTNGYERVKSGNNSVNLLDEYAITLTWYFGPK